MKFPSVPEIGSMAPDFRLRGPGGVHYSLSEFRGEKYVLLVFYPLAFSPVCSHQLPELQQWLPKLEAAGVAVFGISVDSHYANAAFARATGVTFPLLSDWDHEACRAYGVLIPGAEVAVRSLFLVDRDGRLLWREISEDSRSLEDVPSPQRALAALGAPPRT